MRDITEIIIHCTATRPDWMAGQPVEQKRDEIRRWHVENNGWSDIGYHYIIDRDGKIADGRPEERVGAHTKGQNKNSIGIALIGGDGGSEHDLFDMHFTQAQDVALRRLISKLQAEYGPLNLSGHNQYAPKACPCFDVRRWYSHKPARKSLAQSTTLQASAAAAVSTATGVFATLGRLDPFAQYIVIGAACFVFLALGWIARERIKKWAMGVR